MNRTTIGLLALSLLLAGGVVFLAPRAGRNEAPSALTPDAVRALVAQVGRHLLLPTSTAPSVAVVTDAAALARTQVFFAAARNGDRVLIYPDRAVLYRPEGDILVNVGPVVNAPAPAPAPAPASAPPPAAADAPSSTVTIEVRNGSGRADAAAALADRLQRQYVVLAVGNAAREDYPTTLVVASGTIPAGLLQAVGVTTTAPIPFGEPPSTADVLVILGRE